MKNQIVLALLLILIFGFNRIAAQTNPGGIKITVGTRDKKSKSTKEIPYGLLEFFIKDKTTKEAVPVYVVEIGKVAAFITDTAGYSKFMVKPGKYKVGIKMVGYNHKVINKLNVSSRCRLKIEIEMDVKSETMY